MKPEDGFPFGREYRGDIYAFADDETELRCLGIELGRFNAEWACFEDCRLSALAMAGFAALGGKYLADLRPIVPSRYN
ncbi:hypothetical protein [Thauera sinica]|uniref:Uncharacterized protein n=1 Tax=Thauera sinica TaxID=2665146 RepID=A0ABW1AQV4_9RHOO|nr:hypothetical protein [Thauera sp. K11]